MRIQDIAQRTLKADHGLASMVTLTAVQVSLAMLTTLRAMYLVDHQARTDTCDKLTAAHMLARFNGWLAENMLGANSTALM